MLLLLLSSIGTTSLSIKWLINDGTANPLRRSTTSLPEVVPAWKSNAIMHQDHFIVKCAKPASEDPSKLHGNPARAGWRWRDPETALDLFFQPSTSKLDTCLKVPYTRS